MFPSYSSPDHGNPQVDDRFIVLDDLGGEVASPRFSAALFEFVDRRMDMRTVVTSNLSAEDLRGRYDARLIDRWNHIGMAVELKGASLRRGNGGLAA